MIVKNGYQPMYQKKHDRIECRMDKSMIKQLEHIKHQTGISKSELIREAVRRMLAKAEESGDLNITV